MGSARQRIMVTALAVLCVCGVWGASRSAAGSFTPGQTQEFVERLYSVVLQRDADSAGLTDNVNMALALGDDFVRTLTTGFLLSPEFMAGFGSDPSSFVTTLYLSILNRVPAAWEVNQWVAVLGTDPSSTVASFLDSIEYQTVVAGTINAEDFLQSRPLTLGAVEQAAFVTRLYNVLLQRDPDPEGFQHHLQALEAGGREYLDDLVTAFLLSPEFEALTSSSPQDPNKVVAALYLVLLNRAPDDEGLANFVTELSEGRTTITQLVQDFMSSEEGREVLQDVEDVGYLMNRPEDQQRGFQQVYTTVDALLALAPGILTVEEQEALEELQQEALDAGISSVVSEISPSSP